MADKTLPPPPNAPSNRVAVDCFKHAEKVLAKGDYAYGIQLLRDCCHLEPLNLRYRQALRAAQKKQAADRPASVAALTALLPRLRLKIARWRGNDLAVLERAERVLTRRPSDVGAHLALAEAFDNLDAPLQALWALEEARRRPRQPEDPAHPRPPVRADGALQAGHRPVGGGPQGEPARRRGERQDPRAVRPDRDREDGCLPAGRGGRARRGVGRTCGAGRGPGRAAPSGPAREPGHRGSDPAESADRGRPHGPAPYLLLSAHHRREGQLDLAVAVLQQGRGPTRDAFELVLELADLETERLRKELAGVSQRLTECAQDDGLSAQRDRLLEEINARELDGYQRKLAHDPTHKGHALELGVRLYRARQYKEAIPHLQAARAGPSQRVRALLHIGYCFKELGNWDLARRALEEGLRELPREETALRREFLFELARGAFEHGDIPTAVERGNELAFLDFNYRDIGQRLEEWRGSLQRA